MFAAQDGAEGLGAGTTCGHRDVRARCTDAEARLVEGAAGEDGADGGRGGLLRASERG